MCEAVDMKCASITANLLSDKCGVRGVWVVLDGRLLAGPVVADEGAVLVEEVRVGVVVLVQAVGFTIQRLHVAVQRVGPQRTAGEASIYKKCFQVRQQHPQQSTPTTVSFVPIGGVVEFIHIAFSGYENAKQRAAGCACSN